MYCYNLLKKEYCNNIRYINLINTKARSPELTNKLPTNEMSENYLKLAQVG